MYKKDPIEFFLSFSVILFIVWSCIARGLLAEFIEGVGFFFVLFFKSKHRNVWYETRNESQRANDI